MALARLAGRALRVTCDRCLVAAPAVILGADEEGNRFDGPLEAIERATSRGFDLHFLMRHREILVTRSLCRACARLLMNLCPSSEASTMTTDSIRRSRDPHVRPSAAARFEHALAFLAIALAAAIAGCSPARSPADEAAGMEDAQCGADVSEASVAPFFERSAIESVEPLYDVRRVPAQGGARSDAAEEDFAHREDAGAVLHLRSSRGATADWLDRALECHEARQVLGRVPEIPNDPFSLPGTIVEIDVQPAEAGFRVTARGHSEDEGRAILARARAFAGLR